MPPKDAQSVINTAAERARQLRDAYDLGASTMRERAAAIADYHERYNIAENIRELPLRPSLTPARRVPGTRGT